LGDLWSSSGQGFDFTGAIHALSGENAFNDRFVEADGDRFDAGAPQIEPTGLPDFLSKVFLEFHLA